MKNFKENFYLNVILFIADCISEIALFSFN